MVIIDKAPFEDVGLEYSKRGIKTSSKIIGLIKDIFEDNPDASISYSGLHLELNGNDLEIREDNSSGFIIHSELNEADIDNLKIHGFKLNSSELLVEDSQIIDSSIDYFKTTNIF